MTWLTREQIKDIVCKALHAVADYKDDCENHDFANLQDLHKQKLIDTIAQLLKELGYVVPLSKTKVGELGTVKKLIDYIDDEQGKL